MKYISKTYFYPLVIGIFLLGTIIGGLLPIRKVIYDLTHKKLDVHQQFIKNEIEPNNNFDQSNQIQPGIEIQGSITGKEDIDYYKLHLNDPSFIKGELSNLPEKSEILVYNSDKKLIASSIRESIINSTFTIFGPTKGDYYFVIHGKSSDASKGIYSFSISLVPIQD